jgi:L,D-transpeptidase YcbB
MKLLNLAATTSLAALVMTLGVDQLKADHDWPGFQRGIQNAQPQRNTTQGNWWQRQERAQPAQRQGAWPQPRTNNFFGWSQPQPELPRSQNIEPEAPPAKAPVIYTYRADPLVDLADADLTRADSQSMRWRPARGQAEAVFEALKTGSSGVRVTEQQRDDIIAFYRQRDFAPVWTSERGQTPRAADLLDELSQADKHGLAPEDYVPRDTLAGDVQRLTRLELALTAAGLRYAMHASGGRIIPDRLSAYHDLTPPTVDGKEALRRLADEANPGAYLASLHPVHPAYEAMRRELADLRSRDDRHEVPIADGPMVKPGESDPRIPLIRERLAKLGHLALPDRVDGRADEVVASPIGYNEADSPVFGSPDGEVTIEVVMQDAGEPQDFEPRSFEPQNFAPQNFAPQDFEPQVSVPELPEPRLSEPRTSEPARLSRSEAYDAETVAALKAFQAASGLTVDGIIGQNTIAAFNSGNTETRIQRLVHSMERLRWMPRDFGARHVLVNAAGFQTWVIDDGETIWSSKVIVGKPQNQTVFFSDQMDHVVFNPYWGVPGSIIVNEMVRDSGGDPSWFDREGYEVTDLNGQVISPYSVDWHNLDPKRLPFGVRQPPGPKNALGEIKFMFPNKHSIYMHDTPSKPLFNRDSRAFSFGCVRVEDPWGFAEVLLGWERERVASTRATTRNHTVSLERKIPVHIAYFTAWPDENGNIRYHEDVYGRDRLLEQAVGKLTVAMR